MTVYATPGELVWPEASSLSDDELPSLVFGSWVGGDGTGIPR